MTKSSRQSILWRLSVTSLVAFVAAELAQAEGGASNIGPTQTVRRAGKKNAPLKIGRAYTVLTTNGKVFIGTLKKQDAKTITLTPPKGGTITIARKDIEEIRPVPSKKLAKTPQKQPAVPRIVLPAQAKQPGGGKADDGVREKGDPKKPKERVVLLSPKGPVIVEMAIYVNGKSFRMLRETLVESNMKAADKDGDGEATWEEAFSNPVFVNVRYRNALTNAAVRKSAVKRFDANSDGIAQRDEVRKYVAAIGYGAAFAIRPSYTYSRQADAKKVLDTDKDGTLSKAEIAAAARRLKSRDADDNDLLEAFELTGARGRRGMRLQRRGARLPTRARDVFQLGPTANLTSIYNELKKRYADGNKNIRAAAFRAAPGLFKTLDLNKNGLLEAGEMVAIHLAQPSVKLEIRIGEDKSQGQGIIVKSLVKGMQSQPAPGEPAAENATISLPGWKLRFHVPPNSATTYDYTRTANSYLSRYDRNKNGYIDEKDLKGLGAAGRYAKTQFQQWDANSDGKVYVDEIKGYYDRLRAPQMSQVTMQTVSQGPSLFAALDETGDNRLSLREMRNAGARLKNLDRNRNGRIDPDEMPSEVALTLFRGRYYRPRRPGQPGRRTSTTPPRGPKWFVHMDKNGDGDVTLREFLGTKAQFEKLDANSDGFIERKEAETAGKRAD